MWRRRRKAQIEGSTPSTHEAKLEASLTSPLLCCPTCTLLHFLSLFPSFTPFRPIFSLSFIGCYSFIFAPLTLITFSRFPPFFSTFPFSSFICLILAHNIYYLCHFLVFCVSLLSLFGSFLFESTFFLLVCLLLPLALFSYSPFLFFCTHLLLI